MNRYREKTALTSYGEPGRAPFLTALRRNLWFSDQFSRTVTINFCCLSHSPSLQLFDTAGSKLTHHLWSLPPDPLLVCPAHSSITHRFVLCEASFCPPPMSCVIYLCVSLGSLHQSSASREQAPGLCSFLEFRWLLPSAGQISESISERSEGLLSHLRFLSCS